MNTNLDDQNFLENHQEIETINMNIIHESKLSCLVFFTIDIYYYYLAYLRRYRRKDSNSHQRNDNESSCSHRWTQDTAAKNESPPSKTTSSISFRTESFQT